MCLPIYNSTRIVLQRASSRVRSLEWQISPAISSSKLSSFRWQVLLHSMSIQGPRGSGVP